MTVVVPKYFGERHALLDLTICQGERPDFGIVIPPVHLDVSDDFVAGKCSCQMVINKCLVFYEAYPDDHSYGDWDRLLAREDFREAAAEVVSKLA